jgi:subtilisin family serine protease
MTLTRSQDPEFRGSVINMSFEVTDTPMMELAVRLAFRSGIAIACAAGNNNLPVSQSARPAPCKYVSILVHQTTSHNTEPANMLLRYSDFVMCVGSANDIYTKSHESNTGPEVAIIAPGADILSSSSRSDQDFIKLTGTSQAAPFVAGVMAMIVGFEGLKTDPALVYNRVHQNQVSNLLSGFPSDTTTNLVNTGIEHPSRNPLSPYFGAPLDGVPFNINVDQPSPGDPSTSGEPSTSKGPGDDLLAQATASSNITDTSGPTATSNYFQLRYL